MTTHFSSEGLFAEASITSCLPERLLDFYWQLHSQLPSSTRATSPIPPAPKETVKALLQLCTNYLLADEVIWCHVLKLLVYTLQQQPVSMVREMERWEELTHFLSAYLTGGRLGSSGGGGGGAGSSGMGPAVDGNFLLFVELLLFSPSAELLERMMDVLTGLLTREPGGRRALHWAGTMVGFLNP